MNKDVIYIDAEDDITAVIGKIKASKESIIALVPPKRNGLFQSAVNMRLLARISKQSQKRVVIITNDATLGGLAGLAGIPVAKNLQTKPEIVDTPILKIDGGEDVIDGNKLAVGDLSETGRSDKDRLKESAVAEIALGHSNDKDKTGHSSARQSIKASKVPDFKNFRKRFIFIGLGAVVLIGTLVWAIWFAPRATIDIVAKTSKVSINERVSLDANAATNSDTGVVRALSQSQETELSVEFNATGQKNDGDKAKGTVRLSTSYIGNLGLTIPANSQITSTSGEVFTTDRSVTFSIDNWTGVSVGVTARSAGASSNGARGSISGLPPQVSGSFVDATTGGTDKMVSVVSQSDLDKALESLSSKKADGLQTTLAGSFGSSAISIEDSFSESRSDPVSSVQVDQVAAGSVSLKTTVRATMLAVDRADIDSFLSGIVKKEISDKQSQKIYNNGTDTVNFSQFQTSNGDYSVSLTAEAIVGPTIKEDTVKEQAKGLRYGDIQTKLESIPGIDSVDTQFWPFWVRSVPNDVSRIEVKFSVSNASS